jgi:hypothetical protein
MKSIQLTRVDGEKSTCILSHKSTYDRLGDKLAIVCLKQKQKTNDVSQCCQTLQMIDVVSGLGGFNLSLREVFRLEGKTFRIGNVFPSREVCNLAKLKPFLTVALAWAWLECGLTGSVMSPGWDRF